MAKTLADIINGDQGGFELRIGYYLELKHTCMGCYPAIIADQKRTIVVIEKDLLKDVATHLTPRRSVISSGIFYVHLTTMEACAISGYDLEEKMKREVFYVLSRAEYDRLTASGTNPFSWAPGLVGDDMSPAELQETLRIAAEKANV